MTRTPGQRFKDRQSSRKAVRQRRQSERHTFALELALLADGRGLQDVLQSAFGNCSAGRVWQRAVWDLLDQIPTLGLRRRVLAHFLRWFGHAQRHGSQWRVVNAAGYVGRAVETVRELDEQHVDNLTGEVTSVYKTRLAHVPGKAGGRAGGLAAYDRASPRTLHRYRHALRGGLACTDKPRSTGGRYLRQTGPGAIVASSQPPKHARGAVMPRTPGADWAYAQHWLTLPPSPEMLRRWGAKPSKAAHASRVELGAPALPRLPSEPEALRDVLRDLRQD